MVGRPLAVKVYCGVIVFLFVAALLLVLTPSLLSGGFAGAAPADIALMFVPLALILVALWGVWILRWWGVIALSLLVIAAEGFMIATMPERQGVVAVIRGALWLVPLWAIAWAHRKQFR
jgi:hypothetical protein